MKLQPNSITSWEDLKRAFSNQFLGVKRFVAPKQNLTIMFQGPQESLKEWPTRFSVEVVATEEISDKEALIGAMSSMRHDIPFRDDLHQKPAKTYQEFLERVQGFINTAKVKSLVLKSKIVVPKSTSDVEQSNRKQNGKKKQGDQGTRRAFSKLEGEETIDMITTKNSTLTTSLKELVPNPGTTLTMI
ncbi:hypothetical protein TIFTF001_028474 [Ficus carica]|uniref:Retrotransposon gag domain-containing protein n=1 Tax=Ficus carica TaxID=3494 RepID=A0AA88DPW4_FICCA|nr:hypothetical protein TIFTF001_028474 [Ficus carica]